MIGTIKQEFDIITDKNIIECKRSTDISAHIPSFRRQQFISNNITRENLVNWTPKNLDADTVVRLLQGKKVICYVEYTNAGPTQNKKARLQNVDSVIGMAKYIPNY